jgi:hypothetical protein
VNATTTTTFLTELARFVTLRLQASGQIGAEDDLLLSEAPAGVPVEAGATDGFTDISIGRTWQATVVRGDFGLRWALARAAGPLAAVVTCGPIALQPDLRERAVLRRAVPPLARDLLAALVGRDCAAIDEGRIKPALSVLLACDFTRVAAGVAAFTWGTIVSESDALTLIATIALDPVSNSFAQSASAIIADWLIDPPVFEPELRDIVLDVLTRRFPAQGRELANALQRGVPAYVSETAATERVRPGKTQTTRETLVLGALELLRDRDPAVLRAALVDAEAAFVRGRRPARGFPFLEVAYRTHVHEVLRACGGPAPPSEADVTDLGAFLFERPEERSSLRAIARLARALASAEALPPPKPSSNSPRCSRRNSHGATSRLAGHVTL